VAFLVIHGSGADYSRFSPSKGKVSCRIFQGHAPGQVMDDIRGNIGKHSGAAHGRDAHGQVIHHQIPADFKGAVFVPHTGD